MRPIVALRLAAEVPGLMGLGHYAAGALSRPKVAGLGRSLGPQGLTLVTVAFALDGGKWPAPLR